MTFAKVVIIGIVGLLAVLLVVGFFLPSTTHVERSVFIEQNPERIFPLVNDMQEFNRWSPWYGLDESARYTYSGPSEGVGARMAWASDDPQVGTGAMEITDSVRNRRVDMALDFGDQGTATSYIALQPRDNGTQVTWGFDTDHGSNLIFRYIGLLMDSMVGTPYEQGLASLKELAES